MGKMTNRGGAETQRENQLTENIIGCAIEVHKALGPGLLESAYEECLCYELAQNSFYFRRQVPLPVVYKGIKLDCGFRMDVLSPKDGIKRLVNQFQDTLAPPRLGGE